MMRGVRHIVFCALAAVLVSCEHRILTDPAESHYVRVYLDEQIRNVTFGFYNEACVRPEYVPPVNLRAVLADPQSGKVMYEHLLRGNGEDERGRYIDGYIAAPAGTYNFLVHGVGSAATRIGRMDDYYEMYAYADGEPEHLFHDMCEGVVIGNSMHVDTLRNSLGDHFTAGSIALSYFMEVTVKGIEWVVSASATMRGVAGSSRLCGRGCVIGSDPADLSFPTRMYGKRRDVGEDMAKAKVYATFNTFGRIPGSDVSLAIEFVKTDGTTQVEVFDLKDMFETPEVRENQWILLEREVEIVKPDGTGGLRPDIEGWKDIEADVPM